ncbi:hypothetical protein [Aliivibrio logei]|uniref:HEPN AbiU2-like domain-containing protein n=1 Tax=Aliivibrio logei 5S-186 TaxID=626086 RepID=A0ABX3AS68_ALILO|nr:hypothetical protein [Aliivibrio logei]OEF10372.1 hypothetical protein A1Q5_13305 [Aliivibrio logei 5S-186]
MSSIHYVEAVALKNNINLSLSFIRNPCVNFFDEKFRTHLRVIFLDLNNLLECKKGWSAYFKGSEDIQEKSKSMGRKQADIKRFRNHFSGHYDTNLLEKVLKQHEESFCKGVSEESQTISVAFRMMQMSINATEGDFKARFGRECDLFNPEHHDILRVYLIEVAGEAIDICNCVISHPSTSNEIKDIRVAFAETITKYNKEMQDENL